MANLGGVYIVLLSGCGVAVLYALCEWYFHMVQRAKQKRISFREEFRRETAFVLDLHNNTRRLKDSDEEDDEEAGDLSTISRSSKNE